MLCSYSKALSSAGFTDVENAFISEYLPVASGEAVKVYLYGLYLCNNSKSDCSLDEMASNLNMSAEQIVDCFYFWEEFGLVSIISNEPFAVQYEPIRSSFSAKPKKIKAEKYTDFSKGLQALLPSRMISTGEYTEYFNIMETYSIKPEAMLMIVKYCADRKGSDISYRYVSKVAKDFGNRGITTVEKVEKELSSYILRTGLLERILKAMSIRRAPEIEDLTLLKKWTQELNFEEENIVFAAEKIKKGSMAKLDEFLLHLYSTKSFSREEIAEYLDKKKAVYDLAIKINKALSVYVEVLDPVIDNYTSKWLSYGFSEDALFFVATYSFKSGKNTLQDMDELLDNLRQRGLITLSAIGDYFERQKTTDEFLSKLLATAGINRKPTPWDRENLSMWKSWNFSEDMILEATKLASGKSSPIAYINGILSNWKNDGVYTTDAISQDKKPDTQEEYNREYERRRSLALSKAQKNNERALELSGFMDVYGRLNGIEKDLAFAEIAGNTDAIKRLENEKVTLIKNANEMLSELGITLDDLSPRYACEKCNDTGYVGTKRCDCLNKI